MTFGVRVLMITKQNTTKLASSEVIGNVSGLQPRMHQIDPTS